jgi:multiple antibiotic resistance protein
VISIALLLFIVLDPFGNLVTLNTLLRKSDPVRRRRIIAREATMALGMVFPARRVITDEGMEDPLVVPIAMPLIAGPGAISTVILMAQTNPVRDVAVAVALAWLATAVILMISTMVFRLLGSRGALALERLMGILLGMLSVQMVLDGVAGYLAARG